MANTANSILAYPYFLNNFANIGTENINSIAMLIYHQLGLKFVIPIKLPNPKKFTIIFAIPDIIPFLNNISPVFSPSI